MFSLLEKNAKENFNMTIEITLIKQAIDEMVDTIKEQLEVDMQPSISKYDAIRKLGAISEFVLGLYDKLEDDNLKVQVWALKANADDMYQELMGF